MHWFYHFFDSDFKFSDDELLIEFSVDNGWLCRPLCCQFFQKEYDIFLYWNYAVDWDEFLKIAKNFFGEENPPSYTEIVKSRKFYDYLNQIAPLKFQKLTDVQAQAVRKLYQKKLPAVENIPIGCDGFSYRIKIYGESVQKYSAWCIMPVQWKELAEIIEFSMKIIQPRPLEQYTVRGLE